MFFIDGIRMTSTIFVCTTSIMNVSDSPDCLLLQGFRLHLEDQEGHGLLADPELQEYQKVPVESEQQMGMKKAHNCWTLLSSNNDLHQHSKAKDSDMKSTHHFTLVARASSSSWRALKKT